MLRNRIYEGLIYARTFGLEGIRGDFEPLVSPTLFRRAQTALDGRSRAGLTRDTSNSNFPLRRFAICGLCDTPLTGSAPRGRGKHYAYYHCRKCSDVRVRREAL